MRDPSELSESKRAAIASLFADLSATYPEVESQLAAMSRTFRTHQAEQLRGPLNAFLRSQTLKTPDDYHRLAMLVDETLTNLGLCLSFHNEPAMLVGQGMPLEDNPPTFAVLTRRAGQPGYALTVLPADAPELVLMAAPDNIAAYFRPLRDRAHRSRSR